jgi:protein-S-isoprenylcysteine O-methyltransferase Ste14
VLPVERQLLESESTHIIFEVEQTMNKKGQAINVQSLASLAIILVVVAVVLGMGANILSQVQGTQTSGTVAYNATENGLQGLEQLSSWQETIAIVIAAAVIIGIITAFFTFQRV